MNFVNVRIHSYNIRAIAVGFALILIGYSQSGVTAEVASWKEPLAIDVGHKIFTDSSLSSDGKTSCQTCHDPAHAYADGLPKAIGTDGVVGTRNAPSLIGIGDDSAFFWDGRREKLEDAVLDPFVNPSELGLPSFDEVLMRLKTRADLVEKFSAIFPDTRSPPTRDQVAFVLSCFIRSLRTGTSAYDLASLKHAELTADAERGRQLFEGTAGCSTCHEVRGTSARFSDGRYHHSTIGSALSASKLPGLVEKIMSTPTDASTLGAIVLSNADLSSLGRFAVSRTPADIGSFRTPSLRNVGRTAPYMHDGSIATLQATIDHEIYYRGFETGHIVNITEAERRFILVFLQSLTDSSESSNSIAP